MVLFKHFLPLSLHPLFISLIGLILGITGYCLDCSFYYYVVVAALALTITLITRQMLWFFIFGIFFGLGSILSFYQHKNYTTSIIPSGQKIIGDIQEITQTANLSWPYRVKIAYYDPAKKTIYAYIYTKKPPRGLIGDTLLIEDVHFTKPPKGDFKKYLIKEGISATGFTYTFKTYLIKRPYFSWLRLADRIKKSLLRSIKKHLSPSTFSLFCSLFMGENQTAQYKLESEKEQFKQWGIMHYLARSGLHLTIFVYCWFLLLSLIPMPFFLKHLILLLLTILYFLFSTATISFIRAFNLFVLHTTKNICKLPMNAVHGITIIALTTLIYNPYQLLFLDFQLSFFLTFCLAWLAKINKQRRGY